MDEQNRKHDASQSGQKPKSRRTPVWEQAQPYKRSEIKSQSHSDIPAGKPLPIAIGRSGFDWLNLILTGVLVAVTGTYTTVAYFQLRSLKDSVQQSKRSADAATKAAKTAERNSKLIQDQIRLDQRAWLGVHIINAEVSGQLAKVRIPFQNTGKTPALKVHSIVQIDCLAPRQLPAFSYIERNAIGWTVTMPNSNYVAYRERTLSPKEARGLIEGTLNLYISGTIWYRDIFDGTPQHHTEFCQFGTAKGTTWNSCQVHESAD